jgi:N-acetylglucosamine malate deacetylase 2
MEEMKRVLVFVAHPDDEVIGCSGLMQRAAGAMVVFAVDGAPPHYGFERRYGSLRNYSRQRFEEASRALGCIPHTVFRRLKRTDGSYFLDQHLFQELAEAFLSLRGMAREYLPSIIVSHAYEGGHVDHDACSFLALKAAESLAVPLLEFPLYWRSESGHDTFQEFRESQGHEFVIDLTAAELRVKYRMLAEYRTQKELMSVFRSEKERFRHAVTRDYWQRNWADYPFENGRSRLSTNAFLEKVAEFESPVLAPSTKIQSMKTD